MRIFHFVNLPAKLHFVDSVFGSSTIWLKYGFIQNNGTIKVVNSIGSLLQVVYICVYYMYCHEKVRCFFIENIAKVILIV